MTFGIGGQATIVRAHQTPADQTLRPVTERFTSIAPQLSFNFGTGTGWSYLSGGVSTARWFLVPDGVAAQPVDEARIKTVNYGGGARWFIKRHVAFGLNIARFYAVDPGHTGRSPTELADEMTVISAGASVK